MIPVVIDPSVPPDTICFVSPRKFHYVYTDGRKFKVYDESVEEWARRCAVVRNIGITQAKI
jgi:hypothetical protein